MSCLKAGYFCDLFVKNRENGSFKVESSFQTLQFKESSPTEFWKKTLNVLDQNPISNFIVKSPNIDPPNAQASSIRWWEKSLHQNMIEIQSAQHLVDSLLNAGNRLVVLDFYSPGCGGCKTLHPKIKKFKDALAKHGSDSCRLGPAKGLDESELSALASMGLLTRNLAKDDEMGDLVIRETPLVMA